MEKNLALMMVENMADPELLTIEADGLGSKFRKNLELMLKSARESGVPIIALVTFSTHLRPDMSTEQ